MKSGEKIRKKYPAAVRLLLLVTAFAFVFEAVAHFSLFFFTPHISFPVGVFYDALLLIALMFPAFYFFWYCPLIQQIDRRKRVEEELRDSENRFHLVTHSATDAIVSVDSSGRITFWNRAAVTVFGYTADEILGKPLTTIIPERFRETHTKGLARVASTGKSKIIGKTTEVAGLRKDGHEFPVELSLSKWSTGEEVFFTGILRDITERKRSEADLKMANRRMKSNLEVAAMAQKALLPSECKKIRGVNFACSYKPCEELGGDIYNVFQLDENHVGLYILDVSGHGVPAALLSVTLSHIMFSSPGQSSLLKQQIGDSSMYRIVPPAEVAAHLNGQFLMDPDSPNPQYFTLIYGILNLKTYEFCYISAGYLNMIYMPQDSEATVLNSPGFPIGCIEEADFEESSMRLKTGDRLYMYSDGVTDAMNSNEEQFGERRLVDVLDQSRNGMLKDSVQFLLKNVEEWCGEVKLVDDVSVLAFEIARDAD